MVDFDYGMTGQNGGMTGMIIAGVVGLLVVVLGITLFLGYVWGGWFRSNHIGEGCDEDDDCQDGLVCQTDPDDDDSKVCAVPGAPQCGLEANQANCGEYCAECTAANQENCAEFCPENGPVANQENCSQFCPVSEGVYREEPSTDYYGNDITNVNNVGVETLKKICDSIPNCVGFNAAGYLKSAVTGNKSSPNGVSFYHKI